jgi:hypothetical protein
MFVLETSYHPAILVDPNLLVSSSDSCYRAVPPTSCQPRAIQRAKVPCMHLPLCAYTKSSMVI